MIFLQKPRITFGTEVKISTRSFFKSSRQKGEFCLTKWQAASGILISFNWQDERFQVLRIEKEKENYEIEREFKIIREKKFKRYRKSGAKEREVSRELEKKVQDNWLKVGTKNRWKAVRASNSHKYRKITDINISSRTREIWYTR